MSQLVGMFGVKCSEKGFHYSIKITERINKNFYLCETNVSLFEPYPKEYIIMNVKDISKLRIYKDYFKFNDFIKKIIK